MTAFYLVFSLMFCLWNITGREDIPVVMCMYYIASVALLMVAGLLLHIIWRKKRYIRLGLLSALVLLQVGAAISYRMNWSENAEADRLAAGQTVIHYSYQFLKDAAVLLVFFAGIYLLFRYTSLYRKKIVNYIILLLLPSALFAARIQGKATGGAYITFFGIIILGIALLGYPFAAAYFLSHPERKYLFRSVNSLPMNLVLLLTYTGVLFLGCVFCNEFGTLLILGTVCSLLFFFYGRNWKTKVIFTTAGLTVTLVACITIQHIQDRVRIWIDPLAAENVEGLEAKAQSVLYLFQTVHRSGFWGNGVGTLSRSIYPTMNTDHTTVTVLHEYGLVVAAGIIGLICVLLAWFLRSKTQDRSYEFILNLAMAMEFGCVVLLHLAGNLGSFLTAGVGMPFVSDGISVNAMWVALLAIHCSIYDKGEVKNAISKKKS